MNDFANNAGVCVSHPQVTRRRMEIAEQRAAASASADGSAHSALHRQLSLGAADRFANMKRWDQTDHRALCILKPWLHYATLKLGTFHKYCAIVFSFSLSLCCVDICFVAAAVVMWKRERGEIRNLEIISLDVAFVDKWFKPKVKSAMISQGFDSIFKKNWQKMPTEEGVAIVQSAMGMPQVRLRGQRGQINYGNQRQLFNQ